MGMLRRADIGCGRPRQDQKRDADENRRQQAPSIGSMHSTPRPLRPVPFAADPAAGVNYQTVFATASNFRPHGKECQCLQRRALPEIAELGDARGRSRLGLNQVQFSRQSHHGRDKAARPAGPGSGKAGNAAGTSWPTLATHRTDSGLSVRPWREACACQSPRSAAAFTLTPCFAVVVSVVAERRYLSGRAPGLGRGAVLRRGRRVRRSGCDRGMVGLPGPCRTAE